MKFLWVDLNRMQIQKEPVADAYRELGGRGLSSMLIHDHVPPGCDPLSYENLLVFSPGLLTGTRIANTGRISIGAKSPLTGTIKESNAGGDHLRILISFRFLCRRPLGKTSRQNAFFSQN
jgi:aldehyde:ferredoxin oxidoreductase